MKLLLDTPVVIWWDSDAPLAREAVRAIESAPVVFVSAASAWEVAIKTELGKIRSLRTVEQACIESGFTELSVSFAHAQAVAGLKSVHRDPFDRLLVAQAAIEGLTLVTRDPVFTRYGVPVIAA